MSEVFSFTNGEIVDFKYGKGLRKRKRIRLIFECDDSYIVDSDGKWRYSFNDLLNNRTAVTIDPAVPMSGDDE